MSGILTAFGLSLSAGLNAYIPLLTVAIFAKLDLITLGETFAPLESWWAIGVLGVLLIVEVLVDKVPAADTVNDVINTIIRPAAGAVLFAATAGTITDMSPVLSVILGILAAGSVHAGKSLARPVVTATTAGVGNPIVSTAEDAVALVTSFMAVVLPWVALIIALLAIVLYINWKMKQAERAAH